MVEKILERIIFSSRWLLAPFYLVLILGLIGLLIKAGQAAFHFAENLFTRSEPQVIMDLLGMIDLTLTGSLIIIVIFSGYENFVSNIEAAEHADWPVWMTKIDFAGLKLKLFSPIVAISGIQLLHAFMDLAHASDRELIWTVGIHLVFVLTSFLLAFTDKIAADQDHG